MSGKRTVTLEIAGARYRMTTDADESHLEHLAALVNERVGALGAKASASPAQLLAIVALGLADDMLTAEARHATLSARTRETLDRALATIDAQLVATREPEA